VKQISGHRSGAEHEPEFASQRLFGSEKKGRANSATRQTTERQKSNQFSHIAMPVGNGQTMRQIILRQTIKKSIKIDSCTPLTGMPQKLRSLQNEAVVEALRKHLESIWQNLWHNLPKKGMSLF